MVYLLKIFPSEHKIAGEERVVFAFSDGEASIDVGCEEAFHEIVERADEFGLFIDEADAKRVYRHDGLLGLSRYMDFGSVKSFDEAVWLD